MKEHKILIITYYWPPSGGSGVQRWLKFVKYLPQFGIKPYVFTPANPSFDVKDESLKKDVPEEAEVIHFPIWEPYQVFFKISSIFGGSGKSTPTHLVSGKKRSRFQKFSTWVRGNLIIPDPRVFWVKPAVSFLNDFIRDNEISTIITTGPPHSIHLIGLRLKKKAPHIKWVADFRDPWSEWGLLDSLMVGKLARMGHRALEKKVLTAADVVTTITPFYVRRFEALSGRKVELLTNGYDEDDFKTLAIQKTDKFVIRHVGIVNEKCNPRPSMLALKNLMNENEKLSALVHVDFVGEVHPDFKRFVTEDETLRRITTFTPPVPHKDLIKLYNTSSLLLLILTGYKDAAGYMPGKLFEYIATGLPVLGVGPNEGDAAKLMRQAGVGEMVEGGNSVEIQQKLSFYFDRWCGQGIDAKNNQLNKIYSRRMITERLAEILIILKQ
ncbi:MAG TPA: glycosyl transferase [Ohtaekwangia sp.]|nr:glycosyl transferase [Ohtaekwangia sp.]